MTRTLKFACCLMLLTCSLTSLAQQSSGAGAVPMLVNFSGTLTDVNGKPLTCLVGVTFYLYSQQQGGAPVWMETQNVQPGKNGYYTVMLGSNGLNNNNGVSVAVTSVVLVDGQTGS